MTDKSARRVAAKWARRVLHGLSPDSRVTEGGPAVVRVMGRLVSLEARPAPACRRARTPQERSDLRVRWTRSGDLTHEEAELLLTLDETTAWAA